MEEFVTVNKPTFCPDGTCNFGSSIPSATEEFINVSPGISPTAMENFLFVDEETGKPPGLPSISPVSTTNNEQMISFSKPEEIEVGFNTNRPEVSEDFVLYGTPSTGSSSSSNSVIGSLEFDVSPKAPASGAMEFDITPKSVASEPSAMENVIFNEPEKTSGLLPNKDSGSGATETMIYNEPEMRGLDAKVSDILTSFTQELSEQEQSEAQTESKN